MKVLKLFDVSSFIHAGNVNERAFLEQYVQVSNGIWTAQRTLAGGSAFILKAAITNASRADIVFCCDRNPTIKKELLPTYKSNRTHANRIEYDKRVAEYILSMCGATVLAYDGYEADDIIHTLTKRCYDEYDEIHIYTGDSDLYFLVDDKVTIKASSSRAKNVDMSNFSVSFKKGVVIPYNYAIPYKIIYGDSSDCIPGLPVDLGQIFKDGTLRGKKTENYGKKSILDCYCNIVFPFAKASLDIIYPLTVENTPVKFKQPNMQMMLNWADALHCGAYAGAMQPNFDADKYIVELQSMGYYEEVPNDT